MKEIKLKLNDDDYDVIQEMVSDGDFNSVGECIKTSLSLLRTIQTFNKLDYLDIYLKKEDGEMVKILWNGKEFK